MADSRAPLTRYTDAEAKAILERALSFDDREFTRNDLVTMARDLGISDEQLQRAEASFGAFAHEGARREFIAGRRKNALTHAMLFLALCLTLYLLLSFGIIATVSGMFLMPLVFLGMYLLAQLIDAFARTSGHDFEQELARWREQRAKRP